MGKDQRGVSLSVFACGAIVALLIMAGLLTDGGAQLAAHQRADDAAASIARYAMDAAAPYMVDGQDPTAAALTAAQAASASYGDMTFEFMMDPSGGLHVTAHTQVSTMFLQLIGIPQLTAIGQAVAIVIRH